MLNQRKIKLILYILSSLIILVNSQACYIVNNTDPVFQTQYTTLYRIPHSKVKAYSTGLETSQNPLSRAFDYDWEGSSVWFSSYKNGDNVTTDTGEVITDFKCAVIFTFEKVVTIDRLLYRSQMYTLGYPKELLIYYTEKEDDNFIFLDNITSSVTSEKVKFVFSKAITCKKIKLVFSKIHSDSASAAEFQFYQPESSESEATQILNLFTDYSETTVKNGITLEYLGRLDDFFKNNINYEDNLNLIVDRAKNYLLGTKIFDQRREFSTNPNSKNVIRRNGDIQGYMQGTLKLRWSGHSKQPTGIFGLAGETIKVYLEAKSTDKLPKIKFAQLQGHWRGWQGGDQNLQIGKNTFTFPNFKNENYPENLIAGGPIYIINPYTEDEQSEEVKVYIDGGYFFPFYRKGENEEDFCNTLEQYAQLMKNYNNTYMDLMELWGDRILMTIDAENGYKTYRDGKGPNHNLEVWDDYIKYLYGFDGVKYDKNEQYYDKKNYWANLNIRHAQPVGAAYAYPEHVGIFYDDWLSTATYANDVTSFGWGFAHEIGHTMEIYGREIDESTNNVVSKFDECYLNRVCTRGDYTENLIYLTPDVDNVDDNSYRNNNQPYFFYMNFLIWWQVETLFPGYWGKLDNMYRYNDTNLTDFTKTEKQVYLASIVTGLNMSYLYERYGFRFDDSEWYFKHYNSSKSFQEKMQKLADDGTITNKQLKFWYLSGPSYMYNLDNNRSESSGCYKKNKDKMNIDKIHKGSDGYYIYLPNTTCEGHLGFEIYENEKLINFTWNTDVFIDKLQYSDSYKPKYKIRAYDKLLECNDMSDTKSYSEEDEKGEEEEPKGSEVCIYNNEKYDSVADAIAKIPNNADETYEIILKKNTYEKQIEINANIVIKLDQSESNEVIIYSRKNGGYIFKINSGKKLTLLGNSEKVKLVIDGNNNTQDNALIENYGSLQTNYTRFSNSINNQRGGAINTLDNGQIFLYNSLFENNKAGNGGAFCTYVASIRGTIINVIFRGNTANYGGAFYNIGTLTIDNCTFENNTALNNGAGFANDIGGVLTLTNTQILNNKANGNGGGIYIDGRTSLINTIIKNNIAVGKGGGIFENGSNDKRYLSTEESTIITNNTAVDGSGLYMNKGYATFISLSIYDNIATGFGSCIYLNNGYITLQGKNNKLEGEIYRKLNTDTNIYIDSEIFSLQQANKPLTLTTDYTVKEGLIAQSKNYEISEEDLKLFKSTAGTIFLSNNTEIWLRINRYNLTYKLEGNITQTEYHYGEEAIVDYNIPESKYLYRISDNNGKTYNLGDKITIYDSLTLTVELKDLYVATLDFLEKKIIYYIMPNSYFYLPVLNNKTNGSSVIYYWKDVNGNNIFDKVKITKNNTYFCSYYEGYFYIKISKGDERLYYNLIEGNKTFVIPYFYKDKDYYLENNGTKYEKGQEILIRENMNFNFKTTEDSDSDSSDSSDSNASSGGSSHSFLIVFSSVLVVIILAVVIFFVYRYIRKKNDVSSLLKDDGATHPLTEMN